VIQDVDESLRALLRRDALKTEDIEIVFDAPTKDWSVRRNAPTVDLYMYDLREDLRRRQVGMADNRVNGRVIERVEPARWFKLSYLVTAWTQRPEDEHRLLSMLLLCFLRQDRLPPAVLVGSLADLPYNIPYTCGLPPPEDRAFSEIWSALGGELKPSIDLVITAPFDVNSELEIAPPVLDGVHLALSGSGSPDQRVGPIPDVGVNADGDGDGAGTAARSTPSQHLNVSATRRRLDRRGL
jgi:Pvc16 N-terminal domain